jgi:hypothetical protein
MSRTRTRIPQLILLITVVVGVLPVTQSARASLPAGFVTAATGGGLAVDGAPWRAVGVNLWDMDAWKVVRGDITGCWYTHDDLDAYLDASFARIAQDMHATAVRTFGFRMMYTAGGRDWSSTDKLIHYAQKYNVRVIPVFGDDYETCGSPEKDGSWYRSGYRAPEQPWGIDYRSYVVEAVRRYKDSPTVALWQLMNEADAGSDATALLDFSRDMVRAIREEAGDIHHLINLGTVGGLRPSMPTYGRLLDCPTDGSGGCNDLAEAHVFNPGDPLPGRPLASSVPAIIEVRNAGGARSAGGLVNPTIDGWTRVQFQVPASPSYDRWALKLTPPPGKAWNLYVDDVTVRTSTGVVVHTFETSSEGFTATGATLTRDTTHVRGGLASLRASVPTGTTEISIESPSASGTLQQIEAYVRLSFRAPAPDVPGSIAADMHAATVTRSKPFFLGELGYQAAVAGRANCASHRSIQERAGLIENVLALHTDPEYGGSGVLVWDFKDPSVMSVRTDGAPVPDPNIDCWSITPGDPAIGVLRSFADLTPNEPALPAPPALPVFPPSMSVLRTPPPEVGDGTEVSVLLRLTKGGNAMANVRLLARGGCIGSERTDALGLVDLVCTVDARGPTTIEIAPDPASCACSMDPIVFPVLAKRGVVLGAAAGVAERGGDAPLRLAFEDPRGGSLHGVQWRVPACGLSGVIAQNEPAVEIAADCPAKSTWDATTVLRLIVDETADTAPSEVAFVGTAFTRIYRDPATGDCIGISPSSRWIGATVRSGGCSESWRGTYDDWFVVRVSATSFIAQDPLTIVSADASAGRRIDGWFENGGSRFAASVWRPDGIHVLRST